MTKYHIYFHNDLDGLVSSAIMFDFLVKNDDGVASFNPIDYAPGLRENWAKYKFKEPFVLMDFLYHPRAAWWFDHHETTFINPLWRKKYKNDDRHFFDPKYKSCCGAILYHLKKTYGYKVPSDLSLIVEGADIVDSAGYKSAKEAISTEKDYRKFSFFLHEANINNKTWAWLSMALPYRPLKKILADSRIKNKLAKILGSWGRGLKFVKEKTVIKGMVGVLYARNSKLPTNSYMVYYLYPKLAYSLVVYQNGKSYHIGVGRNLWFKLKKDVNVSKLMSNYGGGGHRGVGGVEANSRAEALKYAEEMVEFINKNARI